MPVNRPTGKIPIAFMLVTGLILVVTSNSLRSEELFSPPLRCGDPSCKLDYVDGPYTAATVNTILDHSMKQNTSGAWAYTGEDGQGSDGVIVGFTNEKASGPKKPGDPICISGSIDLISASVSQDSTSLTNSRACGPGYVSYDEHPGYDYRATKGTIVRAVADGTVLDRGGQRCIPPGVAGCDAWGFVGIDHGNGYITQYGHLSRIDPSAGDRVIKGQIIGLSGNTSPSNLGDHLHFESLYKMKNGEYFFVDPYGWTDEASSDPLYSAIEIAPKKLWEAPCHKYSSPNQLESGYGAASNVFAPNDLLIRVGCGTSQASILVGSDRDTTYVYRYGYYHDGKKWIRFSLKGDDLIEDAWYLTSASGELPYSVIPKDQGILYFVAYVCDWHANEKKWKCGCRDNSCGTSYWQLQAFSRP